MKQLTYKSKRNILLLSYLFICLLFGYLFKVHAIDIALIYLAGIGVLIICNAFVFKPILDKENKKMLQRQSEVNKHIAIAQSHKKRSYQMGNKKQHTVWGANLIAAQNIYVNKIEPLAKVNTSKSYFFISDACHNLSDKH